MSLGPSLCCYADNLILLAPSLSALKIMLCTCESFSVSHGLKFNASKTQIIRFGRLPSCNCKGTVFFCASRLHFVDTVTHLGHVLSHDLSDSADIIMKTRDTVKKANSLRYFFSGVDPATLTRLFALSVFLSMGLRPGVFPILLFAPLKWLLIIFCRRFGVSLSIAIPEFSILLRDYTVLDFSEVTQLQLL